MITKKMTIEEIAVRLNTTTDRLVKRTPEELEKIIEHYNEYAKASNRYECDRILYNLNEDKPTS